MKPTKNRIFCVGCNRPKMLFESKKKALNFIKFNAAEMEEETGMAPVRAYYCTSCCGWHVTSRELPLDLTTRINAINCKVNQLIKEERFVEAARLLSYAEEVVEDYSKKNFLSDIEEKTVERLKNARHRLHASHYRYFKEKRKEFKLKSRFSIFDLDYNPHNIEIVHTSLVLERGCIEYQVRPFLLYENEGKYVYAIIRKKMIPLDKVRLLKNNVLNENESFCCYSRHSLDIVGIKRNDKNEHEFQYDTLEHFFQGRVLRCAIKGTTMRLFVKNGIFTKPKYHNVCHYDYWIRMNERNVRFFAGHGNNYTCLVTNKALDKNRTVTILKKIPKSKLEKLKQEQIENVASILNTIY